GPGGVRPIGGQHLQIWQKEHGARRFARVDVYGVLHDADDLEIRAVFYGGEPEALAQGIFIFEIAIYESAIDHGDASRARRIALVDGASADERRPDSLKIAWADAIPHRGKRFCGIRV